MKTLREFKHRGFVVTSEEEKLTPIKVTGGGRRDISKSVPQTKDLYAWQRHAEAYIAAWIDP